MMLAAYSKHYLSFFRDLPHILFTKATARKCFGYEVMRRYFEAKVALEFGGPSLVFTEKRLIPIYALVERIDNCNFSGQTIWSSEGKQRIFGAQFGKNLVCEASNPSLIPSGTYDLVIASHVLEHLANPLRALSEWKRILKSHGAILVIVPHKAQTFDHRRMLSTFAHIRQDYEESTGEDDLTHLDEILELHDLKLDPPAGTWQEFRERCLNNASIRAMHHHVFNTELVVQMFDYWGMEIINVAVERPHHIVVLAKKVESEGLGKARLRNASYLDIQAEWRKSDPFRKAGESRSNRLGNLPMLSRSTL